MIPTNVKRPRNVDWKRAAAILYGDWGTSKAYVIGLAFAVAGYASFWLIAAMCVLTALVGINYMIICRHYPDGGGVYASVRHRSEAISIDLYPGHHRCDGGSLRVYRAAWSGNARLGRPASPRR